MRTDAAGKRELPEKAAHAGFVLAAVGINFRVMTLEVAVGQRGGRAMARACDIDHVQIELPDEPVQMDQQEALPRVRAPMAQQAVLDVFGFEGFTQQRIVAQVDHAGREVVAGAPVAVHLAQRVGL